MLLYDAANVTMYGGIIRNNTAENAGGIVMSCKTSNCPTFTLNGGSIKNNRATTNGSIHVVGGATYTYTSGTVCGGDPYNATYDVSGQTCPAN